MALKRSTSVQRPCMAESRMICQTIEWLHGPAWGVWAQSLADVCRSDQSGRWRPPLRSHAESSACREAQSSEAWFCATFQPQRQDRVKLHPCNSAQHLRKQGPRAFYASSLQRLWLGFAELCRKRQRSRVVERNPNGNLAPTPPYSAKTPTRSGTKCWRHVFQPLPPLDS